MINNSNIIYTEEQIQHIKELLYEQRILCCKKVKIEFIYENPYPHSTHT